MARNLVCVTLIALTFGASLVLGRQLNQEATLAPAAAASVYNHHGPESPSYTVTNITSDFEVREYKNATWAVSFGRSHWLFDIAAVRAGWNLAKYFKGDNADEQPIGVTIPVVGTVLGHPPPPPPHPPHPPKNGSHPKPHPPHPHPHPPAVAIAAFIPRKFEGEPPTPNDRRVKIVHTNATEVYARRFGGYAFSWTIRHQAEQLARALKEEGICPAKGKFFSAAYDLSFWKVFGRKNEVWWVKLPHHPHHNDSRNGTESSIPAGLDRIDPAILFPEEFPPPPERPEGPPEPKPEPEPKLEPEWEVSEGQELPDQAASSAANEVPAS